VAVRTYPSATEYERDAAEMVRKGRIPQGQSLQRAKVNMGRTLAKGVTFLTWAIMRPSRQGDQPP